MASLLDLILYLIFWLLLVHRWIFSVKNSTLISKNVHPGGKVEQIVLSYAFIYKYLIYNSYITIMKTCGEVNYCLSSNLNLYFSLKLVYKKDMYWFITYICG